MDFSKFKTSDWLKVGGGGLFFVAGFLSWWKVDFGGVGSAGANAFEFMGTAGLAWLIFTAIAVITVLALSGKLPAKLPWPFVLLAGAAFGTLLTVIRFLSSGTGAPSSIISRGAGAFLGLIGALAAVAGCVMGFTESGGNLKDLKNPDKLKAHFQSIAGSDTPPPASPPPPPPPPPVS